MCVFVCLFDERDQTYSPLPASIVFLLQCVVMWNLVILLLFCSNSYSTQFYEIPYRHHEYLFFFVRCVASFTVYTIYYEFRTPPVACVFVCVCARVCIYLPTKEGSSGSREISRRASGETDKQVKIKENENSLGDFVRLKILIPAPTPPFSATAETSSHVKSALVLYFWLTVCA